MSDVEMFRGVYNELVECNLFTGRYDAKHGDDAYMYGIATVMEFIADKAGYLDEFQQMFDYNMRESEERVR